MPNVDRTFNHGDRVRYATTGDDGFPLVRYGFVGGQTHDDGPVVVMLDGELGGDVVDLDKLERVSISNVTLTLGGRDLVEDPELRQGLASLWRAEAEAAGLQIANVHTIDSGLGIRDSSEGYALAEIVAAGEEYVLRAFNCPSAENRITLRVDRPNRPIF